jgi:prepilin-type N-terminal cleavage/methylation domain-containing protein
MTAVDPGIDCGARRTPQTDPGAGFSLVEMLIALVLLAASIGLLADALSLGGRGIRNAAGETIALSVAQRELTGAGILWPLASGRRDGRDGDHTFVVEAQPVDGATASGRPPARRLYRVTVEVRWPDGRQSTPRRLTLSTYKLGPPDDRVRP